jgi:hypothetical protein
MIESISDTKILAGEARMAVSMRTHVRATSILFASVHKNGVSLSDSF